MFKRKIKKDRLVICLCIYGCFRENYIGNGKFTISIKDGEFYKAIFYKKDLLKLYEIDISGNEYILYGDFKIKSGVFKDYLYKKLVDDIPDNLTKKQLKIINNKLIKESRKSINIKENVKA